MKLDGHIILGRGTFGDHDIEPIVDESHLSLSERGLGAYDANQLFDAYFTISHHAKADNDAFAAYRNYIGSLPNWVIDFQKKTTWIKEMTTDGVEGVYRHEVDMNTRSISLLERHTLMPIQVIERIASQDTSVGKKVYADFFLRLISAWGEFFSREFLEGNGDFGSEIPDVSHRDNTRYIDQVFFDAYHILSHYIRTHLSSGHESYGIEMIQAQFRELTSLVGCLELTPHQRKEFARLFQRILTILSKSQKGPPLPPSL